MTLARRLAALALCASAATPFTSVPAHAAARAELYLTVTPVSGGAYAMRLTCDPDGGLHPHPRAACDALRKVEGHPDRLNVDPGPCPLIYDPVKIEVKGHWHGRRVDYREELVNPCIVERKLGPVVAQT